MNCGRWSWSFALRPDRRRLDARPGLREIAGHGVGSFRRQCAAAWEAAGQASHPPIADGDVPAVVALWHAANVTRPWNDPDHDIAFARRGPHSIVLVAEADGGLAAAAMVGEDGHRGWVYHLAALPERQGTGRGRAMMAAAEAWLVARGVWKVQLLIREDNMAVRGFYEHLGYARNATVAFQKVLTAKPGGT